MYKQLINIKKNSSLDRNIYNHLCVCKQMSSNLFKNKVTNKIFT